MPLFPGYPICRSHIVLFPRHSHRHWIELSPILNRHHSSWLDVFEVYGVSVLIVPSDCILTPLTDIILLHHANFNVSTRFLVLPSYPGSLSRSPVYPRSAHSISRQFSPKLMNAVSTAIRCAIYPAPLLTGGWPSASSLSVHQ
jgi:hypothetical protein